MSALPLFRSTRGAGPVSLGDALVAGLAPDGGLYLPEPLPRIRVPRPGVLSEVAIPVLQAFLGEGRVDWVPEALSFETPLRPLGSRRYLLDLTLGPSAAFKDVGARFLARALHELAPAPAGSRRTVLVATSGDTGGAVAAAFHGVPGLRVFVLFPAGAVSPRQRLQFTTLGDDVVALGVDGPFDTCQRLVKEALSDTSLSAEHLLTSANSINIGRLLPQMVWYVQALAELGESGGPVTFVVPSGNLGNICAGLLASEMLDVDARFVGAVNENRAFVDWLEGVQVDDRSTVVTPSSAMDVGRPSNLERIEALTRRNPLLRDRLEGVSVDSSITVHTMRRHHAATGEFLDPHTAVGVAAADRVESAGPLVVLSTAHPGKFPETVRRATGALPPLPPSLAGLDGRAERWTPMEPHLDALRSALAGAEEDGA